MENLILNFYNYENIIAAYEHLYQALGNWIYILAIPLYKMRALYIYSWWKLVLLHLVNLISFVLVFNDATFISTFLDITYTPLTSNILTLIASVYLYTLISIILMYINAVIFEHYELLYNLEVIWNVIVTLTKWAFNLGVIIFKIFSGRGNTGPTPQNNTNTRTVPKPQVVSQTVKSQSQVIPKAPITKKQSKNSSNNVYTDKGYAYSLEKRIALGGEGKIYVISSTLLAKIFHDDMATSDKKDKLLKLLNMKKMSSVVFPQNLLYDIHKNFIGYTMVQVYNTKELGVLHIPSNRKKYFPKWTYIDLLDLSITIATILKRLHDKNIIVADFNPRNVLVKTSKKIYFIDIDSYQVDRKASTVGVKMYIRPIHFDKGHSKYLKNQSDDIYALSVIIFKTLVSGGNPYSAKSGSNEDELIERHEFSFNAKEPYKSNVKNELIDAWANLSDSLRNHFEQVFKYQDPVSLVKLTEALKEHKLNLTRIQTMIRRQTA